MGRSPRSVVAVGEALWDLFPDGRRPGGAPCNVAYHATQLGDRGVIVTRVGDDPAGRDLIAFLAGRGVTTAHVQRDPARPTGTVTVAFDGGDPQFTITRDVAWDALAPAAGAVALVRDADAVCVGTLAQRGRASRDAIQALLAEARGRALIVFDANLRPPFVDAATVRATMRQADVVKLNQSEVEVLSALLGQPALEEWLVRRVGVRMVCVTRGGAGASLVTAEGRVDEAGVAVDASKGDAVGAGDAFTAALTHGLVRGVSPGEALRLANRYAALIATKRGAMPAVSPAEIGALGL